MVAVAVAALVGACAPPPGQGGNGGTSSPPVCGGGPQDPAHGRIVETNYGSGPFSGVNIYPACGSKARGTVMYVHGGGYTGGSRYEGGWGPVQALRQLGWAVVSIDYPLSPFAQWPEHRNGVQQAITWWRNTGAARYSLPAYPLVGAGWSAGGQLVEFVNLKGNGPTFDAAISVSGSTYWPDRNTTEAAVTLFGPVFTQAHWLLVDSSSLTHLDPNDPPLLHVHGRNDGIVAASQAELLRDAIADGRGDPARHNVIIDPTCGHSVGCLTKERFSSFVDPLFGTGG